MYALFVEGSFESLGMFATKTQAVVMGRLIARERPVTVVVIYNGPSGETFLCCKFQNGEQIFDGGCCPSPWATAMDGLQPQPGPE